MKGYSTASYHINIVSYDIIVCHTSLQYIFIFKDHYHFNDYINIYSGI